MKYTVNRVVSLLQLSTLASPKTFVLHIIMGMRLDLVVAGVLRLDRARTRISLEPRHSVEPHDRLNIRMETDQ